MKRATPQDTYDHIFGSGAIGYEWCITADMAGVDLEDGTAQPGWLATVRVDNGNDGVRQANVSHDIIMKAASKVIHNKPQFMSAVTVTACRHLLVDADEADFDAPMADELLQFIVLGEIVFG